MGAPSLSASSFFLWRDAPLSKSDVSVMTDVFSFSTSIQPSAFITQSPYFLDYLGFNKEGILSCGNLECFFPLGLLGAVISLLSHSLEHCLTLYPHLGSGCRDVWAQVVWEQTGLMEIPLDNGSIFKKIAIFTMCAGY